MTKIDDYRQRLHACADWDALLLAESGLPGPRGNLELAHAAALEGDEARFRHWLTYDAARAPANTPEEFLAFCGALGLGRLLARGRRDVLPELLSLSSDRRWRTREAVAMALQEWGDVDMEALLAEMEIWSRGSWLERRAAVAALCEPRLLRQQVHVARVLAVLDAVTARVEAAQERSGDGFQVLRKALGYGWSVAVVAAPDIGRPAMARWLGSSDRDVRWIMKENLTKNRLHKMDAAWVEQTKAGLER